MDALASDPAVDARRIRVHVKDSVVTLTGTVDSWPRFMLCEHIAKEVRGVKAVDNQIRFKSKEKRNDEAIRSDVAYALRWDTLVDHFLIDVQVNNGEVRLEGLVGSAIEKEQAFLDAHVAGVKSVDVSDLEVTGKAGHRRLRQDQYVSPSDREIGRAVKRALLYDPRVSSFDILPRVSGGVVTLRGTVDNLKAKRAAAVDARNTVGVSFVKNRLKVRPTHQKGYRGGVVVEPLCGCRRYQSDRGERCGRAEGNRGFLVPIQRCQ
jgi:osmotically-inducible protein OsmY